MDLVFFMSTKPSKELEVKATNPKFMRLNAKFNVRGGVYTEIEAEHKQYGWTMQPKIIL